VINSTKKYALETEYNENPKTEALLLLRIKNGVTNSMVEVDGDVGYPNGSDAGRVAYDKEQHVENQQKNQFQDNPQNLGLFHILAPLTIGS
jgi:hypothetical protein